MNKKHDDFKPNSCLTLGFILDHYMRGLSTSNTKSLRSALLRFVVPGLGGPSPQGKRMTLEEIQAGLEFLNAAPLDQLGNVLDIQQRLMLNYQVKPNAQRVHRHHLKAFVDWTKAQGYLDAKGFIEKREPYRFQKQRVPKVEQKQYVFAKRNFGLPAEKFSDKLTQQFEEFEKFQRTRLDIRPVSIQGNSDRLCRILGWLHQYKEVPIEQLSFEWIVPFVKLRFVSRDFATYGEYAVAKVRAEEECIEEAQQLSKLLEEYFCFTNCSPGTKQVMTCTVLNVAKFIYKGEVTRYQGYDSIPMVQELNQLATEFRKEAKQKGAVVPKEARMVDWEQALEVLEKLRFEADLKYREFPRSSGGIYKRNRASTAIAASLRRFLIVAFLTLMPPDRQRSTRELELGRTLVRGSRENGVFIPVERMQNQEKAQWWIHLVSEDYKTGKTYGEQWHLVPNVKFADGKRFYDYIERWINTYRDLSEPKCNHMFVNTKKQNKGLPLTQTNFCDVVSACFQFFTGVPVTPHRLRDMYVTYLKRIGATDVQLEAAAMRMHHSRATQSAIYNQQTKDEKIAPVYELHDQILEKVLRGKSTSRSSSKQTT